MKYRVVLEIEVPDAAVVDQPADWDWDKIVNDAGNNQATFTPVRFIESQETEDAT